MFIPKGTVYILIRVNQLTKPADLSLLDRVIGLKHRLIGLSREDLICQRW